MCGFTLSYFGASYEDAVCIDGRLWDLDSDDGSGFTSGGDAPCPRCSTRDYLDHALETCQNLASAYDYASPAEAWEQALAFCLAIAPQATAEYLHSLPPLFLGDWPGRVYADAPKDPHDDNYVSLTWPWPVEGQSNHLRLLIAPRRPT